MAEDASFESPLAALHSLCTKTVFQAIGLGEHLAEVGWK